MAAAQTPQAIEAQHFLVRLSRRQTKRKRPVTAPAMLAGLWLLLSIMEVIEHHDVDQFKKYAQTIFSHRYATKNVQIPMPEGGGLGLRLKPRIVDPLVD